MKKKKGWIEPVKPVTVKPTKEIKKMVADTNELFNLFERRNKGEKITKLGDNDAIRPEEVGTRLLFSDWQVGSIFCPLHLI